MDTKQQQFDFAAADRRGALREITFPHGLGVSATVLKGLLYHVFQSGPTCFKLQETLAKEIGCSVRQLQRAISILVERDLLAIERDNKGRRPNVMGVNFQTVFAWVANTTNQQANTTFQHSNTTNQHSNTTFQHSKPPSVAYIRNEYKDPPSNCPSNDTAGVELLLKAFELRGDKLNDPAAAAHAVTRLRSPENQPRNVADVERLLRYAKANNMGPGWVALVCHAKKPWPTMAEREHVEAAQAANEQRNAATANAAAKRQAEAIEFLFVRQGRAKGVPDAAIAQAIQRRLKAAKLEAFQTWGVEYLQPMAIEENRELFAV